MSITIRHAVLALGLLAAFALSAPAFAAHMHHKHKTHDTTSTGTPVPPSGGNDSQGGSAY